METLLRLHVKDIEHHEVASVHENDVPADSKVSISRRWRRQAPRSDADQLAWLTGVPALGWVTLFGVVSLAALVGGGALLLGRW